MKTIILNRRRFTTGIHAISRIFKISFAAENNIRIVKDTFVFPAVFLIKISYHSMITSLPQKLHTCRWNHNSHHGSTLPQHIYQICIREVILFTDVKMSIFIYKSTHIVILIPSSHSSTFTFLVLQSPGDHRRAAAILSDKVCPTKVTLQSQT